MSNGEQKQHQIFKHGAEWLKTDFHLHTKADKEFKYSGDDCYYLSNYIDKLKETDIRIGVITNHNKFDFEEFKSLRKTAIKKEICLFPGIELSVNDGSNGIHTILVFSDKWLENGHDYINQFLNVTFAGKVPNKYENENGRSQDNIIETIKKLEGYHRDFLIIFAHVEDKSGIWNELDGGRIQELGQNEFFKRRTYGFQKVRTHDVSDKKCRKKVYDWLQNCYPAEVEGSDCKSIDEVGKTSKDCYIKIGDFNFEALKYALSDHKNRISCEKPKHLRSYIKSIQYEGGILSKKEILFSSELTTIIGIRGSGKSAVIESLRYALDIPFGEKTQDDKYKKELIRYVLGSGGKITIKALDRFGQEYEIRRILNEQPEVLVNGILQPGITIKETIIYKPIYFGQKDLANSGEGFEKDLVEKLIGGRIAEIRIKIEKQKQRVQEAVRRFLKLSNIEEKIKEYSDKKNDAEHRLKKYKEYQIEEKLQKQIDFDTDERQLSKIISTVKSFINAMEEVLAQYEDDTKNHAKYQSKQNYDFFDSFYKLYAGILSTVDDLKSYIEKSKKIFNNLSLKEKEFIKIRNVFKEEFAEMERQLTESLRALGNNAIRPDDFKHLSKTFEQSKAMLEQLYKESAKSEQIKNNLLRELSLLNQLWHDEYIAIQEELVKVNIDHHYLKIRNEYKADNESFIRFMKDSFKGSNIREATFQNIVSEYQDFHEIFKSYEKAKQTLGNSWQIFEEYFIKNLEIFLIWQKPNKFSIEYHDKELKEHSLGQRASALILFVLSQKENDLFIIDQPEDDLDNQTIYQDVIKLLKSLKPQVQFIFATHNPNIPVLGDAEQVISCEFSNDIINFKQGSIDSQLIQKEIIGIMEGGQEAFNKRKEVYHIWKPQN
ncbi:MAG: histidinol-phosphatase [Desulfobacterales bacterium]|nr:histidinol-phosphatase [Desulfobacterales bacterium]